jgi:hypothetical protein
MSLAKFIDLLSSKSIFCCRSELFEDKTEGEWFTQVISTSHREMAKFWGICYQAIKGVNRYIFSLPDPTLSEIRDAFLSRLSEEERRGLDISDDVAQVIDGGFFDSIDDRLEFLRYMEEKNHELMTEADSFKDDQERLREHIASMKSRSYVSSWFSGGTQSMAMWKAYGLSEESVAITTSKEKLRSIEKLNRLMLEGMRARVLFEDVIYVDDSTEDVSPLIPGHIPDAAWIGFRDLLFKHKAYQYEQEYRLMVLLPEDSRPFPSGIKLQISQDLNHFIERIYLNPLMNESHWFVNVIKTLSSLFGIDNAKISFGEIRTDYSR